MKNSNKKTLVKQTILLILITLLVMCVASVFAVEEVTADVKSKSYLLDMYIRGGFMMHFILAISIWGVYIIIEKAVALRQNMVMPDIFMTQLKNIAKTNDINQVAELCKGKDFTIAKIMDAGLKEYKEGSSAVRGAIDSQGSIEIGYLYKHLQMLGVLANVAPLFGFLGTVTGMTASFGVIAGFGSSRPDLLAAGVAEALITTVYGLIVGIPLLIFYYYFDSKISLMSLQMQEYASQVISEIMQGGEGI